MKAFLLLSAAWLSGAGGNPTTPAPLPATGTPTATPVVTAPALPAAPVAGLPGQVIGSPVIGQAPAGPCCGNNGVGTVVGAPVAAPYAVPFVNSGVVSSPISGCACDPCATGAPAPAAGALAPAAPAQSGGLFGHHKGHLFHRLFGKKTDAAADSFSPVSSAPVASAPVVGGSCGCETSAAAPAAPAQAPGFFSRMFGARPAPAPAPISSVPVYSGAPVYSASPGCSSCGQGPVISGGFPQAPIYQPAPGQLPTTLTPYPGNPVPGTPVVAPGTTTNPVGTPLPQGPKGPEGIKEAPKEPMKLPAVGEKGLQPTSGTLYESGGRRPFDDHHRQQALPGSAADFSSVTGKLAFVHVDGGLWILRYAPLDTVDRNGGSVILLKDRRMDSYREGDIVTVKGQLMVEKASTRLAAPLYQVDTIQLVERPTN